MVPGNPLMLALFSGVRKFGKNFKTIAEVLGTKTEAHVRSFYVNYKRRYGLGTSTTLKFGIFQVFFLPKASMNLCWQMVLSELSCIQILTTEILATGLSCVQLLTTRILANFSKLQSTQTPVFFGTLFRKKVFFSKTCF
jgi:hypothetical protein